MIQLFSYRELIKNLVLKDLKLKYRDSTLGFFWSLANPLLLIAVYSFVFTRMLRVDTPDFPYFLLVGLLPWNFFAQSLMMSTGSVIDNGNLIRKVRLPIEVFPIATVLFNLAQFLLALIVLLPATMLLFPTRVSWTFLAFIPILALHVLFTVGLCFIFSTATVFFRDVRHFTEIFLMLLFWLTPIVYDVRALAESLRAVVFMNPVAFFITSYQDIFYRQSLPSPAHFTGLCVISVLSLACGYSVFRAFRLRFAEEV
ncbi:MAG TPA: ABC transporter permease [Candidatus Acidoferrales bacterium]|nr:ABC transporter permease [Candidatus Acidoferrales bacterium]